MESKIKLCYVKCKKDVEPFWERRNEYFLKDLIPNCNLGNDLTKEDIEWFFSKEYKEHIMMLFERDLDPLYIVFINKDKYNIGFMTYIIYNSEDGKCFVLDYCIYQQYRDNGIGKIAFSLLEKDFINRGATYINLNVSNTIYEIGKQRKVIYSDKVNLRKSQGCICVDMECSAFAAFAQFREKVIFRFFRNMPDFTLHRSSGIYKCLY